tara:strand:- start:2149 stop:2418 length:270 start_codon:yes stop_codon:yes gene_type:complete
MTTRVAASVAVASRTRAVSASRGVCCRRLPRAFETRDVVTRRLASERRAEIDSRALARVPLSRPGAPHVRIDAREATFDVRAAAAAASS